VRVFKWTDGRQTDEHCRSNRCDFFIRNSEFFRAHLAKFYCLRNKGSCHVYLKTKLIFSWSAPHRKFCALHRDVDKTAKLLIRTAYKISLYTWSL